MRLKDTTTTTICELWADCASRVGPSPYLEDVAEVIVDRLYHQFADALVMARAFVTPPFQSLPRRQRDFATAVARSVNLEALIEPHTPIYSLLATRGSESDWNDVRNSREHLAIPLLSEAFVESSPMMAELFRQLGLPFTWAPDPGPTTSIRTFGREAGFFIVEDARTATDDLGRKLIPAGDFVSAHKVKSVFAVGGRVFGGAVLVIIMFSREQLTVRIARIFMPLVNLLKATMISKCSMVRVWRQDGDDADGSGQPLPSE